MSKSAQEMQRLADELKSPAGRRKAMAEQQDEGLGIEPEHEGAPAAAPTEQPAQGEAAPATEAAAEEGAADMAAKKTPRTRAKKSAKAPAAAKPRAAAAPKAAKAPKAPKAPAAAAAPRAAKVRDPLAGIRSKPKLQGVLLGAEISRRVVLKALQAVDVAKLTDEAEKREVTRLIARIAARG